MYTRREGGIVKEACENIEGVREDKREVGRTANSRKGGRERGREGGMFLFTFSCSHCHKLARWVNIVEGKFLLIKWHEIALEWHNKKTRATDPVSYYHYSHYHSLPFTLTTHYLLLSLSTPHPSPLTTHFCPPKLWKLEENVGGRGKGREGERERERCFSSCSLAPIATGTSQVAQY